MDFECDQDEKIRKFRRDIFLKDQDGDIFYQKLQFIFLQMPFFNKQEYELENHFDKWCYFLKHLKDLKHIPVILNEPVFQKGFEIAELSHFNSIQYELYQKSLLQYCEIKNITDTAFREGKIEGKLERDIGIAKTMLAEGFDIKTIVKITGLTHQQITEFSLKNNLYSKYNN